MNKRPVLWALVLCLLAGAFSGCATFRKLFSREPQTRTARGPKPPTIRERIADKADKGRGPKNQSVTRNSASWMDDIVRSKRYDDTPYLSDSELNARERKTLDSVMEGDRVGQAEIDRIHRRNEKSADENHEKIWGSAITSMGKRGTRQDLKKETSEKNSAE